MIPDYPEWVNSSKDNYTPQVLEWKTNFNGRLYRVSSYHNATSDYHYYGNIYLDEIRDDLRGKALPELVHVAFTSKQQEEDVIADFKTRLEAYVVLHVI